MCVYTHRHKSSFEILCSVLNSLCLNLTLLKMCVSKIYTVLFCELNEGMTVKFFKEWLAYSEILYIIYVNFLFWFSVYSICLDNHTGREKTNFKGCWMSSYWSISAVLQKTFKYDIISWNLKQTNTLHYLLLLYIYIYYFFIKDYLFQGLIISY